MNVAIVGYGRMGHEVEAVLTDRGHTVVAVIDPVVSEPGGKITSKSVTGESIQGADVAIEFSLGDGVLQNISAYAQAGVSAVIGTTGWTDDADTVREAVVRGGIGIVAGSNFSIGAHLFFALATQAARLVSELEDYDLFIHELHHRGKKDSPSGTALSIAEKIIKESPRKRTIQTERLTRVPEPDELHVTSTRGGAIPGTHTLYLDSVADTIEIRHSARNRSGFALGAVRAAEWIGGRSGYYTVDEFIHSLLHREEGEA